MHYRGSTHEDNAVSEIGPPITVTELPGKVSAGSKCGKSLSPAPLRATHRVCHQTTEGVNDAIQKFIVSKG
ncbi:hypothetical protein E2C01_092937 [Portunus trituberculatus]|uniref:Uncharacterized protein n=1 Tax=Portunus trituberculatus TaxID=210409 RepID=A0A5B7JSR8_PORTR|nr:hypothetical protein [Portunus trituberculatus]